jgi:hypothetical protein
MAPIRFRSILSLIIRWLGIAVRWFTMCLLHELAKQLAVCLGRVPLRGVKPEARMP